jgi:cobalamin biosynthesis Mg chelatase CobN
MSSCAISDLEVQQDDGTMRGVEIAPEGCHPVSTDECSSGYMAPSENVTFPENSIVKQCCKCKEGEKCNLCADPDACTEEEVEKYISTNETCYGEPPPEEEESEEEEEESEETTDTSVTFTVYALLGLLVLILLMFFLFSRRSKTI